MQAFVAELRDQDFDLELEKRFGPLRGTHRGVPGVGGHEFGQDLLVAHLAQLPHPFRIRLLELFVVGLREGVQERKFRLLPRQCGVTAGEDRLLERAKLRALLDSDPALGADMGDLVHEEVDDRLLVLEVAEVRVDEVLHDVPGGEVLHDGVERLHDGVGKARGVRADRLGDHQLADFVRDGLADLPGRLRAHCVEVGADLPQDAQQGAHLLLERLFRLLRVEVVFGHERVERLHKEVVQGPLGTAELPRRECVHALLRCVEHLPDNTLDCLVAVDDLRPDLL